MQSPVPATYLLIASTALMLTACGQADNASESAAAPDTDTSQLLPAAEVTDAEPAAPTPTLADRASSGTYAIDKEHGYVTFTYSHIGFSNPQLRFRDIDATVELVAENPADSAINVTIAANSIDSGVDEFDEHLNSADWFDTAQFETITFVSTGMEQMDGTTGTMTGDLTIKGITRPVTFDVTLLAAGMHPVAKAETIGVEARGSVLRSDFGLGAYAPAVTDKVDILVSAEFNKVE